MKKLTPRQQKILDFIKKHILNFNYPPTIMEIAQHFNISSPRGVTRHLEALEKKGFIRKRSGLSRGIEIRKKEFSPGVTSIPIVGRVQAGSPRLAIEDIQDYLTLDSKLVKGKDVFLLRVKGDSMIEEQIRDGDYALVHPQPVAENGDIVVAILEDDATIKKIRYKNDRIELHPANVAFKPIIIQDSTKKFAIIGKVTGIIRNLC
jgi:repressor LexA